MCIILPVQKTFKVWKGSRGHWGDRDFWQ